MTKSCRGNATPHSIPKEHPQTELAPAGGVSPTGSCQPWQASRADWPSSGETKTALSVIEVASPSRLDAIPTDEALSLLCGGVEMWPLGPTSFFERVFGKTVPAPSITLSAVFVSPLEGQSARDACQG